MISDCIYKSRAFANHLEKLELIYLQRPWFRAFPACHTRPVLSWGWWQSGLRRMKLDPGNAGWKWIKSQVNKMSIVKKDKKGSYTKLHKHLQGTKTGEESWSKRPVLCQVESAPACSLPAWPSRLSLFRSLCFVFMEVLYVTHTLFTWGSSYVTRCIMLYVKWTQTVIMIYSIKKCLLHVCMHVGSRMCVMSVMRSNDMRCVVMVKQCHVVSRNVM